MFPLLAMDGNNNNSPSEVSSLSLGMELDHSSTDTSKKRKLRAEQLGLRLSKHTCGDHRLFAKNLPNSQEIEETEGSSADIDEIEEGSDPESAKDSNSFVEDSTSALSEDCVSKLELEGKKIWPTYRPSASTFDFGSSSFKEDHLSHNLEEFENHLECNYSQYETVNSIDQCTEKELDDFLYSNGVSPNMYVLSSGRWNVNQDVQSSDPRKPTIDQEFEQYFSTLML